jgi:HAD superfamily phosphatase (TIGR01668 family)
MNRKEEERTRGPGEQASRRDWLLTVKQSVPSAIRILRNLRPTYELESLVELDESFLARHGIRGLLWDVDGTLTHYHASRLAPETQEPASRLFALGGLRHGIVSNSDEIRYRELGRMFPSVPVLKLYDWAGRPVGRRLESGLDEFTPGAPSLGELRPIRKPSAALIEYALSVLGLGARDVVMVGDQYWTDVAGGNLGGIRTIRVPTIGPSSFPAAIRVMQRLERLARGVAP